MENEDKIKIKRLFKSCKINNNENNDLNINIKNTEMNKTKDNLLFYEINDNKLELINKNNDDIIKNNMNRYNSNKIFNIVKDFTDSNKQTQNNKNNNSNFCNINNINNIRNLNKIDNFNNNSKNINNINNVNNMNINLNYNLNLNLSLIEGYDNIDKNINLKKHSLNDEKSKMCKEKNLLHILNKSSNVRNISNHYKYIGKRSLKHNFLINNNVSKGKFSQEEDLYILKFINKNDISNLSSITNLNKISNDENNSFKKMKNQFVLNRSIKQIKERFYNCLIKYCEIETDSEGNRIVIVDYNKYHLKQDNVHFDNIDKIKQLVILFHKYNGNWKSISNEIYGSTPNIVKNKFYSLLRVEANKIHKDLKLKKNLNESKLKMTSKKRNNNKILLKLDSDLETESDFNEEFSNFNLNNTSQIDKDNKKYRFGFNNKRKFLTKKELLPFLPILISKLGIKENEIKFPLYDFVDENMKTSDNKFIKESKVDLNISSSDNSNSLMDLIILNNKNENINRYNSPTNITNLSKKSEQKFNKEFLKNFSEILETDFYNSIDLNSNNFLTFKSNSLESSIIQQSPNFNSNCIDKDLKSELFKEEEFKNCNNDKVENITKSISILSKISIDKLKNFFFKFNEFGKINVFQKNYKYLVSQLEFQDNTSKNLTKLESEISDKRKKTLINLINSINNKRKEIINCKVNTFIKTGVLMSLQVNILNKIFSRIKNDKIKNSFLKFKLLLPKS